ncbi:bacillithiol system redox-active protein YtxJ [Shouchella shacheensis]|uniref:bacillithiol system redox-active protein YtxJ n=1 Tax=Shouchella shacheensis TaxID=1649580 RepID=UPI0007404A6A|nr:bacillithiol system redox-active protein YtxJ [Shouchella shacheensis]
MADIKEITSEQEWHELFSGSENQPVVLLKHSTQCPISADAHKEFEAFAEENSEARFGLVKVIESRPVSNLIAEELETPHKSPQLFVIDNKAVKWTDSHWNIKKKAIREALQS